AKQAQKQRHQKETDKNRQPAQSRGGRFVKSPFRVGHIHNTPADRDARYQESRYKRDKKRERKCFQVSKFHYHFIMTPCSIPDGMLLLRTLGVTQNSIYLPNISRVCASIAGSEPNTD